MSPMSSPEDERDPAGGARDNVSVPHAAGEADRDPNRPGSLPAGGGGQGSEEQAQTPPREESRERDTELNPHKPRRTTL